MSPVTVPLSSKGGILHLVCFIADGVVETVVTFDQGAKWQVLHSPQSSQCDSETSTNRPKRVRNTHLETLRSCYQCRCTRVRVS